MPGYMLILTWIGIIFVKILHLAFARCKIMTYIMPTHVKISIEPGIRELFLNFYFSQLNKITIKFVFFSLFWLQWQIVLVKLLQHVRSFITLISDWNHRHSNSGPPFSPFGPSRDYGMDLCLEVYLWTIYPYFMFYVHVYTCISKTAAGPRNKS
jgi:hypothetical protein